ncbi:MAG: ATP-dependent helicase, partial [Lachnospiraceae bacterium]|nr:ATP-dependent helicase [Lachnospiraceae bacterium]
MTLDAAQKEAAAHFRGPCMVLSGPGSGKTTVITQRVKMLVE